MGNDRLQKVGAAVAIALMMFGFMGCMQATSQEQVKVHPQPTLQQEQVAMQKVSEVNPKLIDANTRFGFKLFSEILKHNQNQNVFVSPSSVAIALAMAYNGASGDTQKAMAKTLEINGMSLQELNEANASLEAQLKNPDPKVQLTIANSLWARQDVSFKPNFLQRNQQFYNAEVNNLNFNDPKALTTINGWVKESTRGKIEEIIDSINPRDVMFLINAIYFKGDWTKPFDKKLTAEKPFYRADGSQKLQPLMSQNGEFRYFETDRFQALSLPYGEKHQLNFYILLPKQSYGLTKFINDLTSENWQQWVAQFRNRTGSVQIPRFKLEYDVDLKQALSALGMGNAFDGQKSNFSELSDVPTRIDKVKHKTFVEVNEEGTEAAAVTSVGIRATAVIVSEPFKMTVDRPFFCAIRDNRSGSILFMGAIVDPK